MTFEELMDELKKYPIWFKFKWVDERWILILWKGHVPVAHVEINQFNAYKLDYPALDKMDLIDKMGISGLIIDYAETPLEDRELNKI